MRAAAIQALAQRGDPEFEGKIELSLFDPDPHVRYTAAAAVIRLTAVEKGSKLASK